MAGHNTGDKPVVILRKKRPAVARSASSAVKQGKAPPAPQTSACGYQGGGAKKPAPCTTRAGRHKEGSKRLLGEQAQHPSSWS